MDINRPRCLPKDKSPGFRALWPLWAIFSVVSGLLIATACSDSQAEVAPPTPPLGTARFRLTYLHPGPTLTPTPIPSSTPRPTLTPLPNPTLTPASPADTYAHAERNTHRNPGPHVGYGSNDIAQQYAHACTDTNKYPHFHQHSGSNKHSRSVPYSHSDVNT